LAGDRNLCSDHLVLHALPSRGTFTSVNDLTVAIRTFIDAYNQRCEPFRLTKTADQILNKDNPQTTPDTRY
jgi:hypothetical protein